MIAYKFYVKRFSVSNLEKHKKIIMAYVEYALEEILQQEQSSNQSGVAHTVTVGLDVEYENCNPSGKDFKIVCHPKIELPGVARKVSKD